MDSWKKRAALFLGGQALTLFGTALVQFAISWHITLTTRSGLLLTVSVLCGFVPQVIIAPLAGVWADSHNKKLMIMLSDGAIALCTLALALLFWAGYQELWLLFVISAARSVGTGVQSPAVRAFLPEITPGDKLMRVNGISATIDAMINLTAPAAAGALYAASGLAPIFLIDTATAAVGIGLMLRLKYTFAKPECGGARVGSEMARGAKYVVNTPWLRQLMGFSLLFMLMFGPVVFLTPLMVARSFGEEPWRLVAHEIAFAIGGILGGAAVSSAGGGFRNHTVTIAAACAGLGLTTLMMGLSKSFAFYLASMGFMGVAMPFAKSGIMTILQSRTRPDMLGRVFSVVSVIDSGMMPLSMAFFGPLADSMSIELQLVITGSAIAVIALAITRFKPLVQAGVREG